MRHYDHGQNFKSIWRGITVFDSQDTLDLRNHDLRWTWVGDTREL